MFGFLAAIIALVTAIVAGTLRFITGCFSSCFGMVIAALILIAVVAVLVLHGL
jgi:hypothetical protein